MATKKNTGKKSKQPSAQQGSAPHPETKVDQHSEAHSNKEFQQHDVKNRLGNFSGDGNHPRTTMPGRE